MTAASTYAVARNTHVVVEEGKPFHDCSFFGALTSHIVKPQVKFLYDEAGRADIAYQI